MIEAKFLIDKTIIVKPGRKIITDYVSVDLLVFGCKDVMAIGDVNEKYQLVKQNAPNQIFPCPTGEWVNERFHIINGRHIAISYLLHGYTHILVAWEQNS